MTSTVRDKQFVYFTWHDIWKKKKLWLLYSGIGWARIWENECKNSENMDKRERKYSIDYNILKLVLYFKST